MLIQQIPITKINPAPYNPRVDLQPGDREYQKLLRSMEEFGCVEPLVWNKRTGHLVGGHQRFKILIARGDTSVDVSVVDLALEREKALNIALNKISGSWDHAKLAALLDELVKVPEFDIGLTGFDLPDAEALIAQMLAGDAGHGNEQFDVEAELERARGGPPVTKPGELILLGGGRNADARLQHRLICGDCTDPAIITRLMDGQSAALMCTDPPYLVDYDGTNHPGAKHPSQRKPGKRSSKNKDWSGTYGVAWDDADAQSELYPKFIAAALSNALAPTAAIYIWHASKRQAMLEEAMAEAGILVHCQIIWSKNRPVLTRTWYAWQHEPCLMGWVQGHKPPKRDPKVLSTVWQVDTLPNGAERPDHPTPKPLELFKIPMVQHTRAGEVCFEPFAGSGTQFIAAQMLGRRCFGAEISPVYCDLIVRRFIAYAGEASVAPEVAKRYRLPVSRGRAAPPQTRDIPPGGNTATAAVVIMGASVAEGAEV